MATKQLIGEMIYDKHNGDLLIGGTDLIDWLLKNYKQGTKISVYVNDLASSE